MEGGKLTVKIGFLGGGKSGPQLLGQKLGKRLRIPRIDLEIKRKSTISDGNPDRRMIPRKPFSLSVHAGARRPTQKDVLTRLPLRKSLSLSVHARARRPTQKDAAYKRTRHQRVWIDRKRTSGSSSRGNAA